MKKELFNNTSSLMHKGIASQKLSKKSVSLRNGVISSEPATDEEAVYANIRQRGRTKAEPKSHHCSRIRAFWTVSHDEQCEIGQILIEVLIAISLFTIMSAGISVFALDALPGHRIASERAAALALAEEGLEAARSLRDESYTRLTAGTHGLRLSGGKWSFFGAQDVTGIFTRSVAVALLSGSRADITSVVTWTASPARNESIQLFTRLTDWR